MAPARGKSEWKVDFEVRPSSAGEIARQDIRLKVPRLPNCRKSVFVYLEELLCKIKMSRIAINYASRNLLKNIQKSVILATLPTSQNRSYHSLSSRKTILRKNLVARFSSSDEKVIKSPFPDSEIPKESIVSYIWKDTNQWDDLVAATCGASGRNYSFGMMKMLIDRFAQALLSHCRLQPRDVVGLLLPNLPEYVIISHGVLAAGLTATFVNPLYTPDEIKRQFKNAGVKCIVTIQLFLDVALNIAPDLPGYTTTICAGGEDDTVKNVQGLQTLLMAGHKAELPGIGPQDLALLPYSSGTTGLPKGVMLTHYNLTANIAQILHEDLGYVNEEEKNQKALTVLPMFHIYGFNAIMNLCIKLGVPLVTLPKFTPDEYVKALVEHRPYFLFVVPSLLLFLASHPAVTKEHLASVHSITSGAASATEGLLQKFQEKVGRDILFRQGYGMTESSPVTLYTPRSVPASKKDTTGVLVRNTEAKVISLSTGESLGPHKSGELLVRGPQVMSGYLNNEEATSDALTEDGWLRTGDVVYYDQEGYFYVVDRCKELIKVKGNQVSPTELENLLLEMPGVADVAVVGIPDSLAGEVPRAYIVPKKGTKLSEDDVLRYVNPKVTAYKKISGGVKFVDSIPRNPSGKILRNELKVAKC